MKLSRSVSRAIVSSDWPVCLASIVQARTQGQDLRAWISMSVAWPW
jgi:hypothetical protein